MGLRASVSGRRGAHDLPACWPWVRAVVGVGRRWLVPWAGEARGGRAGGRRRKRWKEGGKKSRWDGARLRSRTRRSREEGGSR